MGIIIGLIIAFVLFMFIFGGDKGLRNAMMGSYNRIKNSNPGMSESFYMKEALRMRFRSWPDYQLESFILDCSNIEDLIEKIKQQESSGII